MRSLRYSLAIVAVALASAGSALAAVTPNPAGDADNPAQKSLTFQLNEKAGSGQHGTITLAPAPGGKTSVTLFLTGEPASAVEPAHIHVGTCAATGSVKYPLTNAVNGHSVTIINQPMSSIAVSGTSVNVHKSAAQLGIYKACGDLAGGLYYR